MNKKNFMRDFINIINDNKLMTKFIKNIFDYNNFFDYNYLFRMIDRSDDLIIDIYDNVSNNRFNRYIFSFGEHDYVFKCVKKEDIFVNYISVLNAFDSDNKLLKFAYLFKIRDDMMVEYARTFLDSVFVNIIDEILK